MKRLSLVLLSVLAAGVLVIGFIAVQKNSGLANANSKIGSMTSDIVGLKTNVSDLQSKVTESQDRAASLQSSLDRAQADLVKAQADMTTANSTIEKLNSNLSSTQTINSTLNQNLKRVTDPRHFQSVSELTDWLAKDDTNKKYANERPSVISFILQVRALRDGFILATEVSADSTSTYWDNYAVIDGTIYSVNASTDAVNNTGLLVTILPAHPEPLP